LHRSQACRLTSGNIFAANRENSTMHRLALFIALTICTFFAATTAPAQSGPRVYIMMKDGKLTEVINGKQEPVKQDLTLSNGTTLHPDGSIDDKDGNKKKLNEGEYMTMDGKIRLLKNMAGTAPATTKPATKH
jgi:hypothetical protein